MMKKSAAALAALAILSAAPLNAQPETQVPAQGRQNRIPVEDMRSYGATAGAHNARLLGEVLRDFGYDADRLSIVQQERLDDARYRLFPDQSPRSHRLNRTQAIAVVYTALVYPRGTGGRGGWDDDRDRGRAERGGRCMEIDEGVYELLNLIGSQNWGVVDDAEKVKMQSVATRVQGAAIARNYRQVADRAVSVIGSLSEWMPERNVVRSRINALKAAADQACGDDARR